MKKVSIENLTTILDCAKEDAERLGELIERLRKGYWIDVRWWSLAAAARRSVSMCGGERETAAATRAAALYLRSRLAGRVRELNAHHIAHGIKVPKVKDIESATPNKEAA